MRATPLMITLGAVLATCLWGCQDRTQDRTVGADDDVGPTGAAVGPRRPTAAASEAAGRLTLERGDWGPYLADGAGAALYALEGNVAGEKCVDICTEAWPPMLVDEARPGASAGVQPDLVSVVQRPDGTRQVTYANQPLHRYAADTGAGRTTGHAVRDQWGMWHLVAPDGKAIAQAGKE